MAKSYIRFYEDEPKAKTKVWTVTTAAGSPKAEEAGFSFAELGVIKWFGSWRKYAFFPEPDTIFEERCLTEIAAFCETKTKEHKASSPA